MEQYAHKDLTYAIFRAGPVRARVPRLARRRDRRPGVPARDRGRPATRSPTGSERAGDAGHGPAGQGGVLGLRGPATPGSSAGRCRSTSEKWQTDASYERCARFLMEHHERLRPGPGQPQRPEPGRTRWRRPRRWACPATATRSRCSTAWASRSSGPWSAGGMRVRVYTPYGAMLPGMAYLVRRLLENTSNESFLKASFAERAAVEDLLRDPEEVGAMLGRSAARRPRPRRAGRACRRSATSRRPTSPGPRTARRCARRSDDVDGAARPDRYPLVIGGRDVDVGRGVRLARPAATRRPSSAGSPAATPGGRAGRGRRGRPREAFAAWSATPGPRARRRSWSGPRRSCGSGGSSWRPGRSSSAASPGARPTPTSPRRSTSASSTPAR